MPNVLPWLLVLIGIVLLAKGASWLVDGASRIALRLGISAFVVGLTVVGFGTSMPEFAVSVVAASRGSAGLSVGNAIGSNIMNLLLVLGVAAVLAPIHVVGGKWVVRRDLLFGLVPAVILLIAANDGDIERWLAIVLLAVFTVFIVTCVVQARGTSEGRTVVTGSTFRHLAFTVIGIVLLVIGSELMVRGGVELARRFGVSEAVIGLTLVAFGTSLPEFATSVAAAIKGQSEISMGNVLGSNVFNLGLIVGTAFTIKPGLVPSFVIGQDLLLLVLATVAVGLIVLRDAKISRVEGAFMLLLFAAYLAFIIVRGG